ncbi:MAG: SAM-dependent chlorinase/fluorinase [Saprospiraceae bacterium]|nr:SAM-dependent chlorinase/fluorinase [Saprospiraceae bacterium]
MTIVTLTTDFGNNDFYAPALKGAVLRLSPSVQLVDMTHHIRPYDIVQAAFVLENAWREFPEGTIHCIGVNCVYSEGYRFVVARRDGHFFIAPDNGMLSLMFDDLVPTDMRNVLPKNEHFAVKNVFAQAVAHLVSGAPFEDLGEYAALLTQRISIQPVITQTRIRGTVIHIDHFDNAVVNIRREVFEKQQNGRSFSLFFRRNDPLSRLSNDYCDVAPGEALCLFNSAGYLEISINMGRAATLLNLKLDDVVEIVFG